MLRNGENHYGLVTIGLHWLMAIVITGLFALGWYMVELTYYDSLVGLAVGIRSRAGGQLRYR